MCVLRAGLQWDLFSPVPMCRVRSAVAAAGVRADGECAARPARGSTVFCAARAGVLGPSPAARWLRAAWPRQEPTGVPHPECHRRVPLCRGVRSRAGPSARGSWRTGLAVTHGPSSALRLQKLSHNLLFGATGGFTVPSRASLLPRLLALVWLCAAVPQACPATERPWKQHRKQVLDQAAGSSSLLLRGGTGHGGGADCLSGAGCVGGTGHVGGTGRVPVGHFRHKDAAFLPGAPCAETSLVPAAPPQALVLPADTSALHVPGASPGPAAGSGAARSAVSKRFGVTARSL